MPRLAELQRQRAKKKKGSVRYKRLSRQTARLHERIGNPRNTSRTCLCCAHVSAENRQNQVRFACVECGFEESANQVGAVNILAAGHAVLACGGTVRSGRPAKQEPAEATTQGAPLFNAVEIASLPVGEDVKFSPLLSGGVSSGSVFSGQN